MKKHNWLQKSILLLSYHMLSCERRSAYYRLHLRVPLLTWIGVFSTHLLSFLSNHRVPLI